MKDKKLLRIKLVTKEGKLIKFIEKEDSSAIRLNGRLYMYDTWIGNSIAEDGKDYYVFRDCTDEPWLQPPKKVVDMK